MEAVLCNYCQADDYELVLEGRDLLLNRDGAYRLVRCRRCSLIYQNPRLTLAELPAHYPEAYQPYHLDASEEPNLAKRLDAQYRIARRCQQLIRYQPQPGDILDVGCATGLFLNGMKARGWRTRGVELSEYAADYAQKQFGLDVFQGTLEEAAFPDNSFDVITLWDVLEHLIDPKATLTEISRILRPGGLLALGLPNPDCIEARLLGRYWVGWDQPRHLHLFSPAVIKNYLTDAGIQQIQMESLGGRLGLTLLSIQNWCIARGIPATRYERWLRYAYNWPLRLATWPIYRLGELFNRTTSIAVFARRPLRPPVPGEKG